MRKNICSNRNIFIFGLIFMILLLVIRSFFTRGMAFEHVLHHFPEHTFSDHFSSLMDVRNGNPYENLAVYPPFTYLIYLFVNHFLPSDVLYHTDGSIANDMYTLRNSQMGLMSFLMILLLCLFALYCFIKITIDKTFKSPENYSGILFLGFIFSFPMIFTIERGNIILLSMILVGFYSIGINSENKFIREIGLICLAMAACLKLYPAVFGFILIKRRKFKMAIRAIIYGLFTFFLPFWHFGGIYAIKLFIRNILNTTNLAAGFGYGFRVGLFKFIDLINDLFKTSINNNIVLITTIFLLICIFVFTKRDWVAWMCMSLFCILIPENSFTYSLIFLIIPITIFLSSEKYDYLSQIFSIVFAVIFSPWPWGKQNFFSSIPPMHFLLSLTTIIENIGLIILVLLLTYSELLLPLFSKKSNKIVDAT